MNPVRTIRLVSSVTQEELAARAGTSQATISAYENGRKSPTWRTLLHLARSVGLEPAVSFVPPLTRVDRRSLALHGRIAEALAADPEAVLARARRNVESMRQRNPEAHALLDEWLRLLEAPIGELVVAMLDPSVHGRDLRQVTPFAGVLGPRERAAVYRAFREAEGRG